MKSRTVSIIAFATLALTQTARAELIKVSFSAVVSSAEANLGLPMLGATIQGSVVFDTETEAEPLPMPAYLCGPCAGYSYQSAPYLFSVDLGPSNLVTSHFGVGVYDNSTLFSPAALPSDTVEFLTRMYDASSYGFTYYSLALVGAPTAFSGAALPSRSALQSFWQQGAFTVYNNQLKGILLAEVTAFSVSSVPESSTAMLFAFGVGAVAIRRRMSARLEPQAMNEG